MDAATRNRTMMDIVPSVQSGFRVVEAGELAQLFNNLPGVGVNPGVVATGNTKATAVQLKGGVNLIGTVPANSGAVLPPAILLGQSIVCSNESAAGTSVTIFSAGNDIILNDGESTTNNGGVQSVAIGNQNVQFTCVAPGFWRRFSVPSSGSLPISGGTLTGPLIAPELTVTGQTTLDGTTATTPPIGDNSTNVATTAWVREQNFLTGGSFAPINSTAFTGNPTCPTPATADNSTSLATTAFVKAQGYLTGNQTITLSGDATGSGTTAIPVVFPNINANTGTFASVTVNAKGQVTAAAGLTGDATTAGNVITLASSGVTAGTYNNVTVNAKGLVTGGSNAAYLTGNQTITLSGDISGSGTTAIAAVLPNINPNVGTFQGITVNAKGQVTGAVNQNYAPLASPALTGVPTGPTAAPGTNTAQLATTAFVTTLTGNYLPLAGGTLTGGLGGTTAAFSSTLTAGATTLTGQLLVNLNAATPPAVAATLAGIQVAGADNNQPSVLVDAFTAIGNAPFLITRKAQGTAAAPTAVQSGSLLGGLLFIGRGATGYGPGNTRLFAQAVENWTDTAQGSSLSLAATQIGTTTQVTLATFAVTPGCQFPRTRTNNNAPAGFVGEVISSNVPSGSAVALTNNVAANVTSIALTAGDWDVFGNVVYLITGTTQAAYSSGGISTVSGSLPDTSLVANFPSYGAGQFVTNLGFTVPSQRVSLAAAGTVYLVAQAGILASTMSAFGQIWTRRAR